MDFTSSIYNYWESFKSHIIVNYYYFFPPKPQKTVFMLLDKEAATEITFVADDLGNSVFLNN